MRHRCVVSCKNIMALSVTQFSSCDQLFKVSLIFPNVSFFSKCDLFVSVTPFYLSVTQTFYPTVTHHFLRSMTLVLSVADPLFPIVTSFFQVRPLLSTSVTHFCVSGYMCEFPLNRGMTRNPVYSFQCALKGHSPCSFVPFQLQPLRSLLWFVCAFYPASFPGKTLNEVGVPSCDPLSLYDP